MEGEAQKKALAEALDPTLAALNRKETGKEKAAKAAKEKTPEELAQKELQKDIKALLGLIGSRLFLTLRLRDKSAKAMEFAGEITSLKIQHQEAYAVDVALIAI